MVLAATHLHLKPFSVFPLIWPFWLSSHIFHTFWPGVVSVCPGFLGEYSIVRSILANSDVSGGFWGCYHLIRACSLRCAGFLHVACSFWCPALTTPTPRFCHFLAWDFEGLPCIACFWSFLPLFHLSILCRNLWIVLLLWPSSNSSAISDSWAIQFQVLDMATAGTRRKSILAWFSWKCFGRSLRNGQWYTFCSLNLFVPSILRHENRPFPISPPSTAWIRIQWGPAGKSAAAENHYNPGQSVSRVPMMFYFVFQSEKPNDFVLY